MGPYDHKTFRPNWFRDTRTFGKNSLWFRKDFYSWLIKSTEDEKKSQSSISAPQISIEKEKDLYSLSDDLEEIKNLYIDPVLVKLFKKSAVDLNKVNEKRNLG